MTVEMCDRITRWWTVVSIVLLWVSTPPKQRLNRCCVRMRFQQCYSRFSSNDSGDQLHVQ